MNPVQLLLLLTPLLGARAQDEAPTSKPTAVPKLPAGLAGRLEDPFAKLVPGKLPEDCSSEAKQRFGALLEGTRLKDAAADTRLTCFDLAFEIITRGARAEHNQANLRVRYSEPGYVRFAIGKDKEMGYGPDGFWQRFEDGAKLLNSRDYASDRKRITEVRSVAKNFLALADPARLRIQRLEAKPGAPGHVPPGSAGRLAALDWLAIDSPDFDLALGATDGDALTQRTPRLYRATLGLDPKTGRVVEALVQELDKGAPLIQTSTWVSLAEPLLVGKALLPSVVLVRYPNLDAQPWGFEPQPREELYLLEGRLNPELGPDAFLPQRL